MRWCSKKYAFKIRRREQLRKLLKLEVMKTLIEITCPSCQSNSIKRNGKKGYGKQNYRCNTCGRQFIGDHALTYKGCQSFITKQILHLMVRGSGVRDIAEVLDISKQKVLSTLVLSNHQIQPKKTYYQRLEIDELWTYVGSKKNRQWLIYAYDRATGEIVAFVWGKRNLHTAKQLRNKLKSLGIKYDQIASDNWESFLTAFANDEQLVGKFYTVGIEGNNCRIRHRIRRAFRRSCCFSKKLENHFKAFNLAFFYINNGTV